MSTAIRIGLTERSEQIIKDHAQAPQRLFKVLGEVLGKGLVKVENHVKINAFRAEGGPGGGRLPLRSRSGLLRQSITHKRETLTSGYVGTQEGPTSAYAAAQLGSGVTRVTPKRARHLWQPIADNLTLSGVMRFSPRDLMSRRGPRGGRLLRIFRSKRGNLVAVLMTGGRFKRGSRKGQAKGRLMFLLRDETTIHGTDALAKSAEAVAPEMARDYEQALRGLWEGKG